MPKCSIIIPVRNEPLIGELISRLQNNLGSINYEIIIVDKSSPPLILPKYSDENIKVHFQTSNGLADAFKDGLKISKGEFIGLCDGDGQHDVGDFSNMIKKALNEDYDFVVGYKSKNEESIQRRIVSRVMNWVARKRLGLSYKDCMCGVMVIRKIILEKLNLDYDVGFKIVLQIMYKTKDLDLRTLEYPITFHKRKAGESKVGFNVRGIREVINIFRLINQLKRNE